MRGKRLTVFGLSLMLALTSLAFTATAASADSGHPNIIVQVEKFIDKAESMGNNMAARYMGKIIKEGRHWVEDHGVKSLSAANGTGKYPRFILRMGCGTDFDAWWNAARKVAKTGFRHYRGQASGYLWLDPEDRDTREYFHSILFNRALDNYDDAVDDLADCIMDESKYGDSYGYWIKKLLF